MKNPDAKRLSNDLGIKYVQAVRIVNEAHRIAAARSIRYPDAEKRALALDGATAAIFEEATVEEALRSAVEHWCAASYGTAVDNGGSAEGHRAGLSFDGVDWPNELIESLTLGDVTLAADTLGWTVDTVYEGGTQVIHIEVDAEIVFEGVMSRADIHLLADDGDVTVTDLDWNDRYSGVSVTRAVTLTFWGTLNPHAASVETLEFDGGAAAHLT